MFKSEYAYWSKKQREEYSCLDCMKFQKDCKGFKGVDDLDTCAFFKMSGETNLPDENTLGTDRFSNDVIINLIIGDIE